MNHSDINDNSSFCKSYNVDQIQSCDSTVVNTPLHKYSSNFKTNRNQVSVVLFSDDQRTSKSGLDKKGPQDALMFLPHCDVFCDLLKYRPTVRWNQFDFKMDK